MKMIIECQSEGMCIHVGFYVIWYIRLCELKEVSFSTSDGSFSLY